MRKDKVKNICIIANDYPTKNRAVYVFVQQLVETLVDYGIPITVIAPQSLTRSLFRSIPLMPRQETYHTAKGNAYKVYRPYSVTFGNGKKILYHIAQRFNQKNIDYYLDKINPQIVYGHFWECAMKAFAYSVRNNKPLFVACGEGDNALEEWGNSLSDSQKTDIREHVTGVISVSSENMRKCLDYNLCTKQNTIVLPNCVNTDLFCPQEVSCEKEKLGIKDGDFTIAFVGGFTPRKGPDRVAQAVSNLNDTHIKVMFIGNIFQGYGYDFDCPGIVFKDQVSHNKLPLMLNCADVFVLPTKKEGCCNAIVEALACGLPIISSNGSFNDDILDDKNSIRIDSDDINALTNAIAYLRNKPTIRSQMKAISISRRSLYSIENRANKIITFIESYL